MSHRPERKEKNCLNCNAEVQGRFCHVCGQENVEIKETFSHLLTHFIYDITHFDGNFFSTVKLLLIKPGFLSLEYMKGRRMTYLNPIRMYVFTSAFFFLFFFSFVANEHTINFTDAVKTYTYSKAVKEIRKKRKSLEEKLTDSSVTGETKRLAQSKLAGLQQDSIRLLTDTSNLEQLNVYSKVTLDSDYSSRAQYDSAQKLLTVDKRDGWLMRNLRIKNWELNQKYKGDNKSILTALFTKFFHLFPQVLFVSLPIFALLLKLFYFRRKQFYYADHAIFTVHLYCAMFIMIFLEILLTRLKAVHYFGWVSFINFFFLLYILWYVYKAMRTYYQQSRIKTVFKYLLLMFISFFVMACIGLGFLVLSVFTI